MRRELQLFRTAVKIPWLAITLGRIQGPNSDRHQKRGLARALPIVSVWHFVVARNRTTVRNSKSQRAFRLGNLPTRMTSTLSGGTSHDRHKPDVHRFPSLQDLPEPLRLRGLWSGRPGSNRRRPPWELPWGSRNRESVRNLRHAGHKRNPKTPKIGHGRHRSVTQLLLFDVRISNWRCTDPQGSSR